MDHGDALRYHGYQALRFLLVGMANFVLTLAVFLGMLRLAGAHYLVALFTAWATGMGFSYILNFTWVFKPEEKLRFRRHLARYFAANLASITLNMATLHLLVRAGGWDPFLIQCTLIPLIVLFNYSTAKFWALRRAAR